MRHIWNDIVTFSRHYWKFFHICSRYFLSLFIRNKKTYDINEISYFTIYLYDENKKNSWAKIASPIRQNIRNRVLISITTKQTILTLYSDDGGNKGSIYSFENRGYWSINPFWLPGIIICPLRGTPTRYSFKAIKSVHWNGNRTNIHIGISHCDNKGLFE